LLKAVEKTIKKRLPIEDRREAWKIEKEQEEAARPKPPFRRGRKAKPAGASGDKKPQDRKPGGEAKPKRKGPPAPKWDPLAAERPTRPAPRKPR
jgi:hypothetical protein